MRLQYFQHYYNQVKCNILAVAYRGFGDSTGKPNQLGIEKDASAILRHIFYERKDLDHSRVYVHGRSLGGAVAVGSVVGQSKVKGLILENTFTSIQDVLASLAPLLSTLSPLLLRNKWESKALMHKLKCPVLFIRCMQWVVH